MSLSLFSTHLCEAAYVGLGVAATNQLPHQPLAAPYQSNRHRMPNGVSSPQVANQLRYRPKRHFPAGPAFRALSRRLAVLPGDLRFGTYDDRALVVWNAGKQRLDEEKRKVYLKRLEEIRRHLNQGRDIRRAYTAHQIALAQRGNSANGVWIIHQTLGLCRLL